jgi:hypothetical protein
VRKCKLHRALLEELETIARAAKQMFPEIDPPDSVWEGIQARMAQEQPADPIISNPFPGYQVVFAMRVVEDGSPPPPGHAFPEGKSPFGVQILGAPGRFTRREGRR